MSSDTTPNKLESVFVQRDVTNSYYEQINISGSDVIFYHTSSGELTADRISVFAAKYQLGVTPSASYNISTSWASSSLTSLTSTSSLSSDFAVVSIFSETASYAQSSSIAITASYAKTTDIVFSRIFLLMGG